jgi:tryptophan aminotransferase
VVAAERFLHHKATWRVPTAGMFFWVSLLLPPRQDMVKLLQDRAMAVGVLAVPGMCFMPDRGEGCQLRLSFSLIAESHIQEGFRRIGRLVDEAWLRFHGGDDDTGTNHAATLSAGLPDLLK